MSAGSPEQPHGPSDRVAPQVPAGGIRARFRMLLEDRLAFSLAITAAALLVPGSILSALGFSAKAAAAVFAFGIVLASWAALRWLEPPSDAGFSDDEKRRRRSQSYRLALTLMGLTLFVVACWAFLHLSALETPRAFVLDNAAGELLIAYSNGLGLLGGVVAYSALGAIVLLWRSNESKRWWRGPLFVIVCAVGFIAGLRLFDPDSSAVSGAGTNGLAFALLALTVILTPIGIALTSEDTLRKIESDDPGGRRPWLVLTGVGVVGAGVVAVLGVMVVPGINRSIPTPATLVVCGGLAGMVALLVSRSQLDTVVIAGACAALLFFAPGVADPPEQVSPDDGAVVVALGDSYMSGEGAEEFDRGTDAADINECRRAPTAYARIFAEEHATEFPGGLVSYACSGARTAHLTGVPQHEGEPVGTPDGAKTQFTQLNGLIASGVEVDLILLSIGGNDSGFATVGITCVAPGDCGRKEEQDKLWLQNLAQVRLALREVYAELGAIAQAHQIPVVTVPYPSPVNEKQCNNVTLSQSEVEFVNEFVSQLDYIIRTESALAKFSHLGDMKWVMRDNGMRLCDKPNEPSAAGINFIGLQSMTGSPEQMINPANWVHSSFHPDVDGHSKMAEAVNRWWSTNAPLVAVRGTDPDIDDPDREAALAITPQCSMEVVGEQAERGKRCEDQARLWALGETHDWVADKIWVLITAVAGLWLLFIGLFGAHRRSGFGSPF